LSGYVLHNSLLHLFLKNCDFLKTDISQGSVATRLGCGGVFKFVTNFLLSLTVKEFWKLVNIWWSYGQELGVLFFDSQCRKLKIKRIKIPRITGILCCILHFVYLYEIIYKPTISDHKKTGFGPSKRSTWYGFDYCFEVDIVRYVTSNRHSLHSTKQEILCSILKQTRHLHATAKFWPKLIKLGSGYKYSSPNLTSIG